MLKYCGHRPSAIKDVILWFRKPFFHCDQDPSFRSMENTLSIWAWKCSVALLWGDAELLDGESQPGPRGGCIDRGTDGNADSSAIHPPHWFLTFSPESFELQNSFFVAAYKKSDVELELSTLVGCQPIPHTLSHLSFNKIDNWTSNKIRIVNIDKINSSILNKSSILYTSQQA